LDQICASLGGRFGTALLPVLAALATDSKWQHRCASLRGFAQISEHIDLHQIPVPQLVSFMNDTNVCHLFTFAFSSSQPIVLRHFFIIMCICMHSHVCVIMPFVH
jgi:hypothetical protein